MNSEMLSLEVIHAAAERARAHVMRTPVVPVSDGSWLKLELLQPTGSFKVRGFFAAALALPPERLERGLLTVSAGNAALACAYVARQLGVSCRVVMFDTAPETKLEGVQQLGGEPITMPRDGLLAWMTSRGWESEPEAFIHPFADEVVQAGHGAIGLEIAQQVPQVQRVVVPVGGGGLVAGVAAAIKALKPEVEVIGVQSDGYPLWVRTFQDGAPPAMTPHTIADGTTAPYDPSMHERLRECVDGWLAVPEASLRRAIPELAMTGKVVTEGAGALAYAALDLLPEGPQTVAVISGGNVAPDLLASLLDDVY
jgi:threonine dehydratase